MNDVPVTIQYLTAQSRQCLVSRMLSNMKTIKALTKAKKQRGGKLRFSKEETIIEFKQYGVTHKILSPNRIRIAGIPKALRVNGIKQFIGIEGIEFANARLIRRATGYYVQFVCYVPKDTRCKNENNGTIIGVDFGCETSFTLSDGNKIDVKLRESDRLLRVAVVHTATVLDRRRLNKQIAECNQIVKAIKGESTAWGKHPVVKMYTSHLDYLKHYNSCLQNYRDGNYELAMAESRKAELVRPSFVNSTLTDNMKRRLFTKDERFYSQFSEYGKSDINLYFVDGTYVAYQNGKKLKKKVWWFQKDVVYLQCQIKETI